MFKKKGRKEKRGREEFEWRKGGREKRDAGFLNGGVFASLILGPI